MTEVQKNKVEQFEFTVSGLTEPLRLDSFCAGVLKNITRSKLKTALHSVSVNGKPAKLSKIVRNGDTVYFERENTPAQKCSAEKIPLEILYEDNNVIAVNKAEGMVTHPGSGNGSGTLVNALHYFRLFESEIKDEFSLLFKDGIFSPCSRSGIAEEEIFRAGIVHRLDKDTSGVIITARNTAAEKFLKEQFKKRKTKKIYLAILDGVPRLRRGEIKTSVFRSKKNRIKFETSSDLSKGKIAHSAFKVIRIYGNYSAVLFRIFTGRTHQIRLHAKFMGCPVLGDSVYGKRKSVFKTGLMLHAYKLFTALPAAPSHIKMFKAPVPRRFKETLKLIKKAEIR